MSKDDKSALSGWSGYDLGPPAPIWSPAYDKIFRGELP
jgi:hypothetical protein